MKKIIFLPILLLVCSCGNYIDNENGSEHLVSVQSAPVGCAFSYKIDAEVAVYEEDDAHRFLENKIVATGKPGNAYWITSTRTRPNEGVIFGPEKTYVMVANVYDCPNARNIQTDGNSYVKPSSPSGMYGAMY